MDFEKFTFKCKLFFLVVVFTTSLNQAFANKNKIKIDSLLMELQKVDVNNYKKNIEILKHISLTYAVESIDSSIHFANKALQIALKNNDRRWESSMLANLGLIYKWNNEYDKALVYYNKSLTIKKEINYLKEIKRIYYDIGYIYFINNNNQLSLDYFFKGLEYIKENADEESRLYFYISIADNYLGLNDYKNTILYYKKALDFAVKLNSKVDIAYINNWLGHIYSNLSSPEEAFKYFNVSLKLYKELNNQYGLFILYNNLGITYQGINENDKALIYYKKALSIADSLGDRVNEAASINNIGTIYDIEGNQSEALKFYKKSLKINEEMNSQRGIAMALNNIGYIYLLQGKYKRATNNIQESIRLNKQLNDGYNLCNNYNNLANIFIQEQKYGETLNYLQKATPLAIKYEAKNFLQESYLLYSQLYQELNNFKKALEYYILHADLKYNILEKGNTNKMEQVKIIFQSDFLQIENEILKKDNDIHLLELQKQKNIQKYWVAFSVLFLALSILALNQIRLKRKHNKILREKNNELRQANDKLISSEKELKELNATKDKFFSIIAHDIKNPFQTLLGFSELMYSKHDKLEESSIIEYARLMNESSKNIYNLLSNLLEWSKIQLGSLSLKPQKINLNELLDGILVLHYNSSNNKNIVLLNQVNENIEIYADKLSISTVLNNLVNNAIKFTRDGGEITIMSEKINDEIRIMVKDNGVGISREKANKLFKIDESVTTKGTNKEEGTGLGLILCNDLVKQNKGKLTVETELGEGSTFIITLPLKEKP